MKKTLRQKLYDKVGGKGSTWNTEINAKGALQLGLAGLIGFGISGCIHSLENIPYAQGGKNYSLERKFDLGEVTEETSKYQVKGLKIFGKKYYTANTDLGPAMFKKSKSIIENIYSVNEKGKVTGETSIQSGEGGLFFIQPSKVGEKYADWVKIKPKTRIATIKDSKIIKKIGGLGIFQTTHEDSELNLEFTTISDKLHYAIKVEDGAIDRKEEKSYNFYLIPVDNSRTRIDQQGRITIVNQDKILKPTFKDWATINKEILQIPGSERTAVRYGLKRLGLQVTRIGQGSTPKSNQTQYENSVKPQIQKGVITPTINPIKPKKIIQKSSPKLLPKSKIKNNTYTVKQYDTLLKIAEKHNITIPKLMELNPAITNKNLIYIDQTIQLK